MYAYVGIILFRYLFFTLYANWISFMLLYLFVDTRFHLHSVYIFIVAISYFFFFFFVFNEVETAERMDADGRGLGENKREQSHTKKAARLSIYYLL